ncbi:unnamed protein product [Rhizophagus irregularis]|uniref:Uncharacterized protein n=1 Tax=Rhizophagus irregularis TaxID=588596 RepID=A0A916EJU1_9GLOM|nr:unnamed protein product [Rhizophagus irregularis]
MIDNDYEDNIEGDMDSERIYGVTRSPQSGEYAIVTEFKNGRNLRRINETLLGSCPANRPTAVEFENHKEKFTREQKNKWKAILVELATNPSKKSQNMLTSKRLLSLKIGT